MSERLDSNDTQEMPSSYGKEKKHGLNIARELKETLTDGVRRVVNKTRDALRRVFDGVDGFLEKAFK